MEQAKPVLERAERIAEEVLFPRAIEVDRGHKLIADQLDVLADDGFYGVAGAQWLGGETTDLAAACRIVEIFASACLTTTFVWMQHHGAVLAVGYSDRPALREEWLGPLCRGERRAGLALDGARPGPPGLRAREVAGGWLLDGTASWVTGWGLIDTVHLAARTERDDVVWLLADAQAGPSLSVEPLDLVAAGASATVRLHFTGHLVAAERMTGQHPHEGWAARDAGGLRMNGSLPLGVAGRCATLLDDSSLRQATSLPQATSLRRAIAACRARLDAAEPAEMPEARAAAAALAVQAATMLVTSTGSRAVLLADHAQRLAREALFLLVFGTRPAIREALLRRLSGDPDPDGQVAPAAP